MIHGVFTCSNLERLSCGLMMGSLNGRFIVSFYHLVLPTKLQLTSSAKYVGRSNAQEIHKARAHIREELVGPWDLTIIDGGATFQSPHFGPFKQARMAHTKASSARQSHSFLFHPKLHTLDC